MHIAEGIITGAPVLGYTLAGMGLVGWGARRMKGFSARHPEDKPLLGMGGAFVFFLSLIPIPAFSGTCSHPCGSPLLAILLGPSIGIALTGISLLLQAAFFAHGGFSTWGANVVALGLFGGLFGWGAFKLGRKLGLPVWAAGCLGGLLGDIMVYAASGLILGGALANAPSPQYSLNGYLSVIYLAYLPTQGPIALMEMVLTGLVLHYAYRQRPEVLENLGVLPARVIGLLALVLATGLLLGQPIPSQAKTVPAVEESEGMMGMDEAVNEKLAQAAGQAARSPFIDTESLGDDVWNALLLLAGGGCGFVIGRGWHLLFGKEKRALRQEGTLPSRET